MDAGFQVAAPAVPGLFQQQNAAPTTGQTVPIANTAMFGLTVITPAATLAALTVSLPADATSQVGQTERIAFMRAITLLTINGATSILNAPVSAALGDNIGFQKVAANTWARI